ncbi:hypothetical protein CCO48_26090 [Salmonella enterica subsp. enterica serovar Altendorf]|uniref:TauD/TfdA family dioxygenase n=1 Tax=Salmonella enterica TaxID=28901 RepID=UPI000BA0C72E|nr:TauD/TfdA family dioxygenase [Salmonella enterica]OZU09760.1 hypothetical protein CCO48_26090 [Salmonella enterica subsp. enterica serovar Altendorf]
MNKEQWYKDLSTICDDTEKDSIRKSIDIASLYLGDVDNVKYELEFGNDYYVMDNIPIDLELPEPPLNGLQPYDKKFVSELTLSCITGVLGYNIFSYLQEKKGAFFHDITLVKVLELSKSGNGVVDFSFHTDAAYLKHKFRPEVLSLLCLNNECNTGTQIVSLDNLIKNISGKTINVLKSNEFFIKSPDSFEIRKESQTAILYENDNRIEIQFSLETTTPLIDNAQKAIVELTEAANDIAETLMWKPGNFLIFNNRRTLHGRRVAEGKSWLQRCYGSRTISMCSQINLTEGLNHG